MGAGGRFYGVAGFRFYGIANGVKTVLYGRSGAVKALEPPPPSPNLGLFPLGP